MSRSMLRFIASTAACLLGLTASTLSVAGLVTIEDEPTALAAPGRCEVGCRLTNVSLATPLAKPGRAALALLALGGAAAARRRQACASMGAMHTA